MVERKRGVTQLSTDVLAQILWDYNNLDQPLQKSDCILVLGGNDIRVAQRGAELYLQGYAPLIIFSGKVGRLTKGKWNKPEAEIFAEEAIKMGVPTESILIENKSTNTGDNLRFTRKLLIEKGASVNSLILVQLPYSQRRAYASLKKIWPEMAVVLTAPQVHFNEYPNGEISKGTVIGNMVGEIQRIKDYPENGFQVPQDIPGEVLEAYEELVKRGYTDHLINEDISG